MNIIRFLLLSIITVPMLTGCVKARGITNVTSYDERTHYSEGVTIHYPKFDVQYVGMEFQDHTFVPLGPCYNFRVSSATHSQIVCWSSGTGDIGDARFNFEGNCYTLSLQYSDRFGRLKSDELIVGHTECLEDER